MLLPLSLVQSKDTAAYCLTVDVNVHAIGTTPECARTQIVYVLTAINSEVRACVGGAAVNGLVDGSGRPSGRSGQSDSCRRQRACRNATQGECELNRYDAAPNAKHTRPIEID